MNLFNSNQPQQNLYNSNSNYQMPFPNQSGNNQFPRPNSAGTGSFVGNNPLTGTNSLFTQTGNNNLFGNNMGSSNQGQNQPSNGPVWNANQNNPSNNLFSRSNTNISNSNMPASLFPGPQTQNTGNNMFQTNQGNSTNNLFSRSNSMIGAGNTNQSFMGNNNTSLNNQNNSSSNFTNNLFNTGNRYNTRSNNPGNFDKGTINYKYVPKRNSDHLLVCCITYDKECKKSLEELRCEDYHFIKTNQVPDHIKMIIQKNIQAGGQTDNGTMIGSNANNMFNQQGTMGNTNNSIGIGGSNNNLFGNNTSNNNQQRGWPSMGGGATNNMFASNNNNMNPSGNNLFSMGGSQGGMGTQSNFPGNNNNLFAQGNNTNQNFINNQNPMGGNNIMNSSNNLSNNNLFNSNAPNRFQTQNNMFSQNNPNNQLFPNMGQQNSNMGPFPNRQAPNFLPQNGPNANNNLFQNRMGNGFPQQNQPNLFQQGQMQQPNFFPNQNQMGMGMNQFSLQGSNPHLFPGQNPQMGANGQPSLMGQFYQNFPQQNFMSPDAMGNPHLFPYQSQMHFQQPTMQGFFPAQQIPNSMNPYGVPSLNPNPQLNFDKLTNSLYTPYQEDKSHSYAPRNTLNDVASNLDSKLSAEASSPSSRTRSYLPYNPFERRGGRRMDIGGDRETVRNSAFQWQSLNQSIARRQEDTFTLIKKSKFVEDDIEIIMRPKPVIPHSRNRSYSPVNRNNRSYSPVSNRSREQPVLHSKVGPKNIYNSTIRVNVGLRVGLENLKNIEVLIFQKAKCWDLKIKSLEMFRSMGVLKAEVVDNLYSLEEITSQATLSFNGRSLGNDSDLEQMNLGDNSTCILEVPIDSINPSLLEEQRRSQESNRILAEISPFARENNEQNYPASKRAPKLTRFEYKTQPSIEELNRMNEKELAAVEGFTIWNKQGKIEFEGRTDVRDVDLDEAVVINQKNVEVYPEDKFKFDAKPLPGEKLNRPALITLYNCFSAKRKSQKEYEEKARQKGFEFVDYDEKNGVYRIRVKHF